MLSLVAAVMLTQADFPPPPPPPPPAADAVTPAPLPAPAPAASPGVPADAPVRAGYQGKSRGWLLAEKKYLEESRPALAPLALIGGGGAALLFVAILSAVVPKGNFGNFPLDGGVLAVFGIAGGAGMVTGGLLLFFAMARAATADSEIAAVREALDRIGDTEPPPGERPGVPAEIPGSIPQVRLPPVPAVNVRIARF